MDRPKDDEIALARRLLLVVGLAFLVAQLIAFSLDRPPSWDEAIYLSQVAPGAEALPFVPSRARGITFLAAPVLQLGGSLVHLRLFLVVASAVALTAAFRSWAKVIGLGAVAAAVLFAGAWPALFYGSELMPNLWVALTGVAATAILARRLMNGEGRYDELLAGGLVAVTALLRPLDAVVLAAALDPPADRGATSDDRVDRARRARTRGGVDALARRDDRSFRLAGQGLHGRGPARPHRRSGPCSRTSINTSP